MRPNVRSITQTTAALKWSVVNIVKFLFIVPTSPRRPGHDIVPSLWFPFSISFELRQEKSARHRWRQARSSLRNWKWSAMFRLHFCEFERIGCVRTWSNDFLLKHRFQLKDTCKKWLLCDRMRIEALGRLFCICIGMHELVALELNPLNAIHIPFPFHIRWSWSYFAFSGNLICRWICHSTRMNVYEVCIRFLSHSSFDYKSVFASHFISFCPIDCVYIRWDPNTCTDSYEAHYNRRMQTNSKHKIQLLCVAVLHPLAANICTDSSRTVFSLIFCCWGRGV